MPRMMVSNRGSVLALLAWQWKKVLFFLSASTLIYYLHHIHGIGALRLPTTPMAIIGAALGIFVSFRTNSAYDRWWEGRRLWGQLVNASRLFCSQVLSYLPTGPNGTPTEMQRALVRRHVVYIHVLRCALRDQAPFSDEAVKRSLSPRRAARSRARPASPMRCFTSSSSRSAPPPTGESSTSCASPRWIGPSALCSTRRAAASGSSAPRCRGAMASSPTG